MITEREVAEDMQRVSRELMQLVNNCGPCNSKAFDAMLLADSSLREFITEYYRERN